MVAVDRIVRICNACLEGKLATKTVRFSLDGRVWTGDFCDAHLDALTRSVMTWAKLSEELTIEPADPDVAPNQIVQPKETRIQRVVAPQRPTFEQRQMNVAPITPRRTVVVADDDVKPYKRPAMDLSGIRDETIRSWTFTQRAYADMDEKGVSPADVWRQLDSGAKTPRPGRDENSEVWEFKDFALVVVPAEKRVITIMKYAQSGRTLPLTSQRGAR